jgi:hypothetical protein
LLIEQQLLLLKKKKKKKMMMLLLLSLLLVVVVVVKKHVREISCTSAIVGPGSTSALDKHRVYPALTSRPLLSAMGWLGSIGVAWRSPLTNW